MTKQLLFLGQNLLWQGQVHTEVEVMTLITGRPV